MDLRCLKTVKINGKLPEDVSLRIQLVIQFLAIIYLFFQMRELEIASRLSISCLLFIQSSVTFLIRSEKKNQKPPLNVTAQQEP